MNRLNRNVEYALIALQYMGKNPSQQLFSAKDLAGLMKVPFDPLSRVMQLLAKNKIILSEQGPAGGYLLSCDFSSLSLYDLIKVIQGPLEIVRCLSEASGCELSLECELKSPVTHLNEKLISFYKDITLQELFSQSRELSDKNEVMAL